MDNRGNLIKVGSLNCRGLNSDNVKRRKIFQMFKKKHYDLCILLETHCTKELETLWLAEWGYKGYFASYKSNARGVAILFRNSFEFSVHNTKLDVNGRYCILDITIKGIRLTLAAIYGPNVDTPQFFKEMLVMFAFKVSISCKLLLFDT